MTKIGDVIDCDDEQIKLGAGFDHPFIFNQYKDQVELSLSNVYIALNFKFPGYPSSPSFDK